MFNPGDVLRVIQPIRGQLVMGQEMLAAERQPVNELYCRVRHPDRGDMVYRSARFVLAARGFDVEAAAAPPIPEPAPIPAAQQPAAADMVLEVGDIVRIAREYDMPGAVAGWVGPMNAHIGPREWVIEHIGAPYRGAQGAVRLVGNQWNWDRRSFDFVRKAADVPAQAPVAAKVGPIADEDFVVGMRVKCIRPPNNGNLQLNGEYVVTRIHAGVSRIELAVAGRGDDGLWNMSRFHYPDAEQVPAAIIQPAKEGVVQLADVAKGLRMLFVGDGRYPDAGGAVRGMIYVCDGPHEAEGGVYFLNDGDRKEAYLNNFHYAPPEPAGVIVPGSIVRVIDRKNTDLRAGIAYQVKSINGTNCVLEQHPGKLFALRRFELAAGVAQPAGERPNPVINWDAVRKGMYFKIVKAAGIPDALEEFVGDGRYYRVSDTDRGDDTVYMSEPRGAWIPADSCEFYEREGKYIAPPPKPKEERTLREIFKAKHGGVYHGSLVSFAYRTVDGRPVTNLAYMCYAPIRHAGPVKELIIGAIPMIEQVRQSEGEDAVENFKEYLNYIIKESPWADCFITKDVDEAIDAGFVMDTTKTLSQAVGAAVAARQGHEYYAAVPTFLHFVKKGYSGNVAFMMSMVARLSNTRDAVESWTRTTMGNNHHSIDSGSGHKEILSFFAKGFPDYGDVPCTEQGSYQLFKAIDQHYDNPRNTSFNAFAKEQIEETAVGEGFGRKVTLVTDSVYAFADTLTKLLKEQ